MTNPGPFLQNGSSKIQFFNDFSNFSVRGCWGQPMLPFWKLIYETQNLLPGEATMHHNSIKLLVFLPLRADLLCILHYETPCTTDFICKVLSHLSYITLSRVNKYKQNHRCAPQGQPSQPILPIWSTQAKVQGRMAWQRAGQPAAVG